MTTSIKRTFCFIALLLAFSNLIARTETIREFPISMPGQLGDITKGPSDALYFKVGPDKIGVITTNGIANEYISIPLANDIGLSGGPLWRTYEGSYKELWFASSRTGGPNAFAAIGKRTLDGSLLTIYQFPLSSSAPSVMVQGFDGNIWVITAFTASVWKITPGGVMTEYRFSSGGWGWGPVGAATGSDGNIWFTVPMLNAIMNITPEGVITQYPISAGKNPQHITQGPDGNMWFIETGNKIAKITMKGQITEYSIPTTNSGAARIIGGPDGNVWFTESSANQIAKITMNGQITEYSIPTADSGVFGITVGPDRSIWFTEPNVQKIGVLYL